MPALNSISVSQLNRLIGTPDCPHVIDISIAPDFEDDPFLIPGSVRHAHTDFSGLLDRIGETPAIIVCQRGLKLSQGLAAMLRSEGRRAEYLEGGMHGWRDAAETTRIPASKLPAAAEGSTLWVTRHRPKIDRIACPWLIRRFIDPGARFLFVSPAEVLNVSERFGATPFDIEDVTFTHHGDRCTFDTMLDVFDLRTEPLDRLARIVRAADTNRHELAPEAAGLLAVSVGLSRQYPNDSEQLEAGLSLYDALYRWARDGHDEGHSWP